MSYDIEYCKKYEPVFGSWRIKKKLGEGNFGAVFEIEREDFGTRYHAALKVISIPKNRAELESIMNETMDETATERYIEQIVERIVKEFELMAKLKGNSNVVSYEDHQVIKHEEDAGWDILIRMELLTPLLTYTKTREITRRDIVNIGIDICRALELCQKHNIIHRDIKPENIFVSETGDFKLGDFGIAKQVEEAQSELTKIGTPTYMAPEVVKGQPYDHSVDMYSLGVVLYRFLNHNRIPFVPQHPAPLDYNSKDIAFGERINSGKPFPVPSNVGSSLLSDVIIKACSYNPVDRYASPSDMRRALENVLASESDRVLSVSVSSNSTDTPYSSSGSGRASSGSSSDYEKTSLLQTQNRYTINIGETVVLENTTDVDVTLTRVDKDPIDIVITNTAGEKTAYSPWRGLDITLVPGEKVNIRNTSESMLMFYGSFGSADQTEVSDESPTKKSFPVLLAAIAALAIIIIAGVAILGGKGKSNNNPPIKNDAPVSTEVVEEKNADEVSEDDKSAEETDKEEKESEEKKTEEKKSKTALDSLPDFVKLDIKQIYKLSLDVPEEDRASGKLMFTSANTEIAVAGSDGSIIAAGEGITYITAKYDGKSKRIDVWVADSKKLKERIAFNISEAESQFAIYEENCKDKEVTPEFEEKATSLKAEYEEMKAVDLESADISVLMEIDDGLSEFSVGVTGLITELLLLPNKPCPVCESTSHFVHPRCSVCGSTSHTVHPQCTICGSYDHRDDGHPRCSYCGSTSHTSHPKCNICGSLEHAVHPAISVDI